MCKRRESIRISRSILEMLLVNAGLFVSLSVCILTGHKTLKFYGINSIKLAARDGIYRALDLKGHIQDFGLSTIKDTSPSNRFYEKSKSIHYPPNV